MKTNKLFLKKSIITFSEKILLNNLQFYLLSLVFCLLLSFETQAQQNPCNIKLSVTPGNTTCGLSNGTLGYSIGCSCLFDATFILKIDNGTSTTSCPMPSIQNFTCQGVTNNLAAATYTLTATYGAGTGVGCMVTQSFTIGNTVSGGTTPVSILTDVGCGAGASNGSAQVSLGSTPGIPAYTWSNGATSNIATGLSPGTYFVTVDIGGGCTKTGSVAIPSCDPAPIADFSASSACLGISTQFTDLSTGATSWSWDFGDGTTSTDQNPGHLFGTGGSHTVKLTVKGKCGCSHTVTKVITVNSSPGPKIVCPSTVCPNASAPYTTNSICTSYNWSVTGGTIISGQNTSQILVDWGAGPMGTITLSTSGCTPPNCSTPTTVNIPILPPNPVITGPGVVCRFNTKNYSLPAFPGGVYNWSIVPSTAGTITSGQGTSSVNIQWSNPANPDAQLIATIGNPFIGCKSTATLPIKILTLFSISGTTQVCKGSTSTVTANPVGVYSWTVSGGGGTVTAGQGTATGTFSWNTTPGTYTVTATNSAGLYCNTTATAIITVVNVPPADSIAGQKKNVCPGSTYAYSAWSPAGGTYSWTAVNGTIASPTTNPVNVTWGATGPYSLTVVQVLSGCNSDPITINVDPLQQTTPPITGLQTVCNNGTYTYQLPNITGATYSWTLNPATAGSVITGQGSNVATIQFTSAGNVTINVAISLCPTPVNTTLTVLVRPAPSPTINVTGILCTGSTLTLSSGGVFPAYEWKNAAMTAIGSNSSVNISTAGPYVLTVTDINGCTGKTVVTIEDAPKPDPSISTPDKKTYCSTETINTTLYVMVGTGYTYQWYRNGTPAGTGSSLNVTTTGSYYVVVTNSAGCIQTASTINIIQYVCSGGGGSCPNPPCFSGTTEPTDFGGNGSSWLKKGNGGSGKNTNEGVSVLSANEDVSILTTKIFCTNTINFTDNSTNTSSVQWSWDFGDGTAGSSLRNPSHTFAKAGYYLISFNVRFSNGNVGFIQKSIEIPVVPDFDAKVNCGVATFTDLSTHTATSNITSWNWNFGDASTSTVQNPVHTYATPGTYNVTLTVTAGGCIVTYNKNVVVPPFPVAQFSFPSTCASTPIPFTDASTGTGILFWSWDFGDGSTSQVQSPSHTYVAGGTYTVSLKVTDINGCTNTKTQSVTIVAPSGGSVITASGPTKLCAGQTVTLTSPAATSYMWSNGATTQSIVVSQSGIYSVIPFSTSTCKNLPPPVTVNVWPLPNVSLSNTTSVFCSSSSFTTTVPYNSGYSYQWHDSGGPLAGKTAFSFNTNSAGTYRVVVTDAASGCSATSVPLTLTSLPSPSAPVIAGPASFCKRSSATLTASSSGGTGALTYSWLTGQTTTSITVSSAGFYQVQVTDQNGCSRSAGKSITVNPLPDFSIFPAGCYTKCGKDSIFGPTGYATYQWQLNGANISTAQNIKSTISGTYKLIISTSLGCIDTSGDLNLTIAPLPVANAGPDIILCGGTAQLNGTGGGIYTWNPPTFLSSTTIANPTSTPTSTIDYELLVTDKNGCKDIDSVKVTVNPSFTVSTNQTNIICSGGTGSASTSVGSGTSPYTYTWNNGQTTATATGLTAGDYTVTVTDAKGCTSTTSSSIISPPPLTGQFTKGTANCTNCGCKEWLMVTGTGGTGPYSYSWPDGYVNRYKNQLCPGSYMINIKDKNGCSVNINLTAP